MSNYNSGRPSKQIPPNDAGEYRYRDKKSGSIDYVGETNNLNRRMQEHERSDKPVSRDTHDFEWKVASTEITSESRREHEKMKIEQHNPQLNQRSGGGGRKSKN